MDLIMEQTFAMPDMPAAGNCVIDIADACGMCTRGNCVFDIVGVFVRVSCPTETHRDRQTETDRPRHRACVRPCVLPDRDRQTDRPRQTETNRLRHA